MIGSRISKEYKDLGPGFPTPHDRIIALRNIYKVLKIKKVPNVDCLITSHLNRLEPPIVLLEPRGNPIRPCNAIEVTDAVTCILEALVVSFIFFYLINNMSDRLHFFW